ncbi:GNAT family N-acetyltransferase [Halorussus lipolyticus]|uniref:GNAT family N-acetyltransferase n=1 Tax=Halorussus lipolyticus TaxID=3034024 RepID=UPI0023E8AA11|nr:GNAT family N-acetyltransferase [Halorussus sp. DT80]
MDDLSVRSAEAGDVADVRRIARESWHAAYDDIVGPESVGSVVDEWYDLNHLRRSVERDDGVFLVAEIGGGSEDADATDDADDPEVVGFAQGVLGGADDSAELPRIYVHPDHWGEGAGSAMLERVEDELADRGAERLRLVVLADNEIGNAFYERHGYPTVGSRESEFEGETYADYVREKEL